jgi:CheY-like chemotaxis protein
MMDAASSPRSILLVDDDHFIRGVLRTFLIKQGYQVLVAASGEEALRLSEEHTAALDLVITDLIMPGMSGQEMVQRLLAGRPGLRVIYMSGYSDECAGATQDPQVLSLYLAKPFTMTDLGQAVKTLLA